MLAYKKLKLDERSLKMTLNREEFNFLFRNTITAAGLLI